MPEPTVKLATPHVYLVGQQQIDDTELDRFLADHDVASWETDTEVAGQKLVETAGRICYWSFAKPRPGGNTAYIDHLLQVGHGSVMEHAIFSMIITGVSRSFTHELVRHRAGFGFSQLSQRYVDESDTAFVVPPALREEVSAAKKALELYRTGTSASDIIGDDSIGKTAIGNISREAAAGLIWLASMERAARTYDQLSDYLFDRDAPSNSDKTSLRKSAREAARSVLPNATETKIFVTANARALRHFIEMRANPAADREIRRVAVMILRTLQEAAPNLFGDYVIEPALVDDSKKWAMTPYRKV